MPNKMRRYREQILEMYPHYTTETMTRRYVSWSEHLRVKWLIMHNIPLNFLRVERVQYKNAIPVRIVALDYVDLDHMSYDDASRFNHLPNRITAKMIELFNAEKMIVQ